MRPWGKDIRPLLVLALLLPSLASPILAAPKPAQPASPELAAPAETALAEPQAGDQGWVLDLAPGGFAPGSPAAVVVDEHSDRVYCGGSDGWLLAFDRRTHRQTARAKVDFAIQTLALDPEAGRLYAAGERYADQSHHVATLRLPALELERAGQIASRGMLRQLLTDPQAGRLYAVVLRPGTPDTADVVVLDAAGAPLGQQWALGASVVDAAFDAARGRLFALAPDYQAQAATVRVYSREGVQEDEAILGVRATRLLLDPERRRLYATADDGAAGRLEILDADSLVPRGSLAVSRQPSGLALDPQTGHLWLAGTRAAPTFEPVLEVVDPTALATTGLVSYSRPAATMSPRQMAVDAGVRRLWVANNDASLSVLDLDSRQPVFTAILSDILSDVAVDEGTGRIFVTSSNADTLYAVDPAGGVAGRVPVGRYPTSLRVDSASGRVFVLNQTARTITVVDGRSLRAVAELRLTVAPAANGWDIDPERGRIYAWRQGEVVAIADDSGQEVALASVSQIGVPNATLVVDRDAHRVHLLAYNNAILDGNTLVQVGQLPGSPLSLAVDRANRRGYAVNWCTAKSCGIRTYVYDMRDYSLLAQLEGVGEVMALNPALGHLYFPGSPAFVVDAHSFERTPTGWRATDLAADPGRGRIYALDDTGHTLRAVPDRYPRSATSVREEPWAKIQIVWPHDGAPVSVATLANVGATIFQAGTFRPLGDDFASGVQLWRAVNNDPAVPVATGVKRASPWPVASKPGCTSPTYLAWEFNDVDVSPARDANNRVFFYLTVDGRRVATNVWGHAVDARTYFPRQDVPKGTAPAGEAVDTRIQIVWPNDGAGNERPVAEADFANVGVFVYNHGSQTSVPADFDGVVRLYRSLNNGVEQLVGTGKRELVSEGGVSWPRWVFGPVDVSMAKDPANKYYFRAVVEGKTTYAGVWSHGADGRTFFPKQDVPVGPCH